MKRTCKICKSNFFTNEFVCVCPCGAFVHTDVSSFYVTSQGVYLVFNVYVDKTTVSSLNIKDALMINILELDKPLDLNGINKCVSRLTLKFRAFL